MIHETLIAVQNRIAEWGKMRYVAEDWGQLDQERPPVKYPCTLIDIEEVRFSDLSRKVQQGDGVLTLRIAQDPVNNFSSATPGSARQYELLELVGELYVLLQGFTGNTFTGLTRISLRRARRDDSLKEYVLQFRFGFADQSAYKHLRKLADIPVEIHTDMK